MTYPLVKPPETVYTSAYRLDWEMTRGDKVALEFIAEGVAEWGAGTWLSTVRKSRNEPVIITPVVTATVSGSDLNIGLTHGPTPLLTAGRYIFDIYHATAQITRFAGVLTVHEDVTP